MQIVTLSMREIVPYKNNPRNNIPAIDAVAESIRQNGYRARIIVDENHVIIAGHTRYFALKKLGYTEAEVQMETDMTEEQKKKYRLLDNKTNEYAEWDFDKLTKELENLDFGGFDFGFDMSSLDSLKNRMEDTEPVYSPDGVKNETPEEDDPYLPDGYDDDEIKEYTDRQEEFTVKKRVIITYLPEQESKLASLLGIDSTQPMKVVYDLEELGQS